MPEQTLLQLGLEYLKANKIQDAITALEEATKQAPHDFRTFSYLGIAYAKSGKPNLAIGALQSALHLKPDAANIRYNLGLAYQEDGLTDMAIHEFKEALVLDPSYHNAEEALKALQAKMCGEDAYAETSCARHPDEPAVGICAMCRLPVCKDCKTPVNDTVYCSNCASKAQ